MTSILVLTVIGPDRPGLVGTLSKTIADHEGNWLASRMSHLAGKFAGIVEVEVPKAQTEPLIDALEALASEGIRTVIEASRREEAAPPETLTHLEVVGQDRPGIVREVSQALTESGVNVEELTTDFVSAAMSGEALFRARAELRVPPGVELEELRTRVEAIAQDVMVELGPTRS